MTTTAYVTDHDRKGRTIATAETLTGRGIKMLGAVSDYSAKRDPRLAGLTEYHVTDAAMAKLRDTMSFTRGGLALAMAD